MKKITQGLIYFFILALSAAFIYYGNLFFSRNSHSGTIYDKETELDTMVFATVASVDSVSENSDLSGREISFTAKTFGDGKGKLIRGKQMIRSEQENIAEVSIGDRVVLLAYGDTLLFQYYFRLDKIIILGAAFGTLLLIMGRSKGFNTMIALTLTCLSLFFVFIPAISAGYNIYIATIVVSVYIIWMTFVIVYGLNRKSMIAALSCMVGVVFSGVLTGIMDRWMKLTGYLNDSTYMLGNQLGFDLDVRALIFSMIAIGALGAIMDVSMSITSALSELKENSADISAGSLIKSGMNIGRDIMGTMSNTLILAYIGSSLVVVMLYASSSYPLLSLLNKEEIIFEFLQSLVGSLSLLLTIPLTALIAARLLRGKRVSDQYHHRDTGRK